MQHKMLAICVTTVFWNSVGTLSRQQLGKTAIHNVRAN